MHLPVTIAEYKSTIALIAEGEARKAAIFVHGFGGDPFDTWANFHGLIERDKSWDDIDLYFYAYDSIGDHIAYNSQRFEDFLNEIEGMGAERQLRVPPNRLLRDQAELSIEREMPYAEIWLVGHS